MLVIDNDGRLDEGCIGDLVALECAAAGIAAVVVWGLHRDTAELRRIGLPVFSLGTLSAGPRREDPRPADAFDRGAWWSVYTDPVLDGLERQIDISNQNLKSAEARFRQAEAIVAEARAGFFPTATFNASAQRSRTSGGRVGSTGVSGGNTGNISNFYSLSTAASWHAA